MNTLIIKIAALLLLQSACSSSDWDTNNSYQVKEREGECAGAPLEVFEQLHSMREISSSMGLSCIARPVELPNKETLFRTVCQGPQGEIPFNISITEDKDSCELALKELKKNPQLGIQVVAQQRMESNLWLIEINEKSCIPAPYGIEEFTRAMQRETGEVCRVTSEDFPIGILRTVLCGDMKTGTAWLLTDSEQMCQSFLKTPNTFYPSSSIKL